MRVAPSTALAALVALLVFAMPAAAGTNGGVSPGASTGGLNGTTGGTTPGSDTGSGSTGGTSGPGHGGASFDPTWVPGGRPDAPVASAPSGNGNGNGSGNGTTGGGGTTSFARRDIPAAYLELYRAAGQTYGVDWRLLAALGKNESDHGRATLPGVSAGLNLAGCCSGPMQICDVATCGNVWQAYAIDANGDGQASVYDPADAIPAAAALVRDLEGLVGRNPRLILAAYNAGPGTVQHYRGVPPFDETVAYVRNGVRYIRALRR